VEVPACAGMTVPLDSATHVHGFFQITVKITAVIPAQAGTFQRFRDLSSYFLMF